MTSHLIDRAKAFYSSALTDPAATVKDFLADGFVLENPLPEHIPFGGLYEGAAGFLQYLSRLAETLDMGPLQITEWVADGNTVVARGSEASLVRATGKRYAMEFVHWLRFTPDGRLQYMREFNDTAVIGEAFRS